MGDSMEALKIFTCWLNPIVPRSVWGSREGWEVCRGLGWHQKGLWIQLESLEFITEETVEAFMCVSDKISSAFQKHPFWCPVEKWVGWLASPTQWTWVWVNSGSWTGWPGVLQSMGSKRVRHDWVTELNWEKGLEGDDCFNQRNDILGLTNPGLKRTGNFCFFPLGSWLRCCEKLQSHKEEPKCSIHSPVVPWAIATTNHLPWGMPSWMF